MPDKPVIVVFDLEGCLTPEIWINIAIKTNIPELKKTTRDITDYDELMQMRLAVLKEHGLTLKDIRKVIYEMDPLPGTVDFLNWIRQKTQLIILSDTFYEFARPLMGKLNWPTLFCHTLEVDSNENILNYHLRIKDGKKQAVKGFQDCGFFIIAIGDSYNDTGMLSQADRGVLFRAPDNVVKDFPNFPVYHSFEELKSCLKKYHSVFNT